MGTPSTAAVRAAAIADETYSRFARENCPGNAAAVHFAGLSQEDIARVIDRETGLTELAAAVRDVLTGLPDFVAEEDGGAKDHWGVRPEATDLRVGQIRRLRAALLAVEGPQ
jgi:hypothetical protein